MFDGMAAFGTARYLIRTPSGSCFQTLWTDDTGKELLTVAGSWRNATGFESAAEAQAGCDYLAYEGHGEWVVVDRAADPDDPYRP